MRVKFEINNEYEGDKEAFHILLKFKIYQSKADDVPWLSYLNMHYPTKHVTNYNELLLYIFLHDPDNIQLELLPFEGKNIVIYRR